jgi:hypothetical protein
MLDSHGIIRTFEARHGKEHSMIAATSITIFICAAMFRAMALADRYGDDQ